LQKRTEEVKPLLQVESLTHRFKNGNETTTVLQDVNFSVARSEMVALLGSSGSGKSTLLNLMAGLMKPTEGSIRIEGQAIEKMSENELALFRRSRIGFIFQSFELIPHLTARENVELPLVFQRVPARERKERALEMLAHVGLEGKAEMFPSDLSGGQQQRVSIARALVTNPSIVFADEPTGNLDSQTEAEIIRLLVGLNRTFDTTFVVVTHEREVAVNMQRVLRLRDGKLIDGETEDA